MKNDIVITDSAKFEEVIELLEKSHKKIKDIFINEKNNKEEINGTDTWTGYAQESLFNKYDKLSKNFDPIDNSLEIYINFLKKTLEDYTRTENEISNNINQLSYELNVNS